MISSLGSAIRDFFSFLRQNDIPTIWARIRRREVPWLVQFTIYGLCGVSAFVLNTVQLVLLSKYVIPGYEGMIVNGQVIDDETRALNFFINGVIAFLVTNAYVYFANVLLVFRQGRHHPWLEFLYFTFVNAIGFVLSQAVGYVLIHQVGIGTNMAILTSAAASMVINFLARKFFIFKG